MKKTNRVWLAVATCALMAGCSAYGQSAKPPMDTGESKAHAPLTYLADHVVTVYVDNIGERCAKPATVRVDNERLQVKGKKGSGPKGIRWRLAPEAVAKCSLVAIEWTNKGDGDGNTQFEPDASTPGFGVQIFLKDKFTDEKATSYSYSVWVGPKHGMGAPIHLDPIIENIPE